MLSQYPEASDILTVHMIPNLVPQFHRLAPGPAEQGIIYDEDIDTLFSPVSGTMRPRMIWELTSSKDLRQL